jgi:hypothetical protein
MTAGVARLVPLGVLLLCVLLIRSPELGAQAGLGLAAVISLVKDSAGALEDFAKGINAVVCTVDLIADHNLATKEGKRLTAVSNQLTELEIAKSRFVRHVDRYLADPSTQPWEELRKELTAQLERTRTVYQALDAETDFKAIVPQAAGKLIIALDEKAELLQHLQGVPKPTQPAELGQLRKLRAELERELGGIEAAHDGFVRYIEARTSHKVTCPPRSNPHGHGGSPRVSLVVRGREHDRIADLEMCASGGGFGLVWRHLR